MNSKLGNMLNYLNVPRIICHHLLGAEHRPHHRMITGTFVMAVGVVVAKQAENYHFIFSNYIFDGVGYGIHGLGLTPYIEALTVRLGKD